MTINIKCAECNGFRSEKIEVEYDPGIKVFSFKCSCGHKWVERLNIIETEPPEASVWLEEGTPDNHTICVIVSRFYRETSQYKKIFLKIPEDLLEVTQEGTRGTPVVLRKENINDGNI